MSKKRFRVRFYGRVQGVGFRYTAYHIAESYGLSGWVENEYDGSVLGEVQGDNAAIDEFLGKLRNGRYIEIDDMEIKELPLDDDERYFEIRS